MVGLGLLKSSFLAISQFVAYTVLLVNSIIPASLLNVDNFKLIFEEKMRALPQWLKGPIRIS